MITFTKAILTPSPSGEGLGVRSKNNIPSNVPFGRHWKEKSKSIKSFSVITPTSAGAWLGITRGAIGFALIFLCLLSLYQDKESKCNSCSISFEIKLDSNAHNPVAARDEAIITILPTSPSGDFERK